MRLERAILLATVALTALTLSGVSQASWWSRPVADESDLTMISGGRVVSAPPAPSTLDSLQNAATRVVGAGVGLVVSGVSSGYSVLASVPGWLAVPVQAVGASARSAGTTVSQFAWEVAYVFGANGTPVVNSRMSESDPPVDRPVERKSFQPPEAPASVAKTTVPKASASLAPASQAPASQVPAPEVLSPVPVSVPDTAVPAATLPAQGGAASAMVPLPAANPPPVPVPAPASPPAVTAVDAPADPLDPKLFADFVFDKARRRADGSFFVPKPLQRLFDLRTQKVETSETALSVRLPGRIVPDPNAHGDVEASLIGRIEPPKTGLPVLGEEVKQGQILGYVTPSVGVVDRTQVRREVARLTNDIRLTAESLELMKQFWFVPFRDGKIIQSEMRLEGLRRERASLLPMLQTQEALRASTDGVISVSNALNGRIVHPGDKIFEIVNPNRLWIEAIAADPDVAKTAAAVDAAVAVTPEGQSLDIGFVGSGLALQQQAVPLMFRIEHPIDGLRVGRPVTVAIRSQQKSRNGIAVPRDAVVTGSSGLDQVWEHVAPEIFVPRTVKTEAIDGRSVLIVAGLAPGAQIVTRGTRLLVQLQ